MTKVISVTNMKGGVGKTTLTANLGHCLSLKGNKVLLVDADPQFNLTQYCMNETTYERVLEDESMGTIHDIFIPEPVGLPSILKGKAGGKRVKPKKVVHEIRNNLEIIPSSIELIDFIDQRKSGSERRLCNYIKNIKDQYAFVLIDCPPTSTILSRAAYLCSDAYIIPMGMDYFSVMGIPLLEKDIRNFMDTYGVEIKGLGIIRTKFLDWTTVAKKHRTIVESFSKALKIDIFESAFRQRQEVQNALSDRAFILEYKPNGEAATDIKAITNEFLKVVSKL